jgi:hypothetical protein
MNVLGKLFLVAVIIAMTLYHRIAGIVALILVIALLNRNPIKEGLTFATPSPAPISFKSPAEFRQKYCLKGVADDPTQSGTIAFNYMLSPAFFTLDASGNPTMTKEEMDALGSMVPNSFNKCTPLTVKNGGHSYETIHNMCDPACDWTMNPAPSTAPPTMPTTGPAVSKTTEGFNPMSALRPYVRTGRHILTDGAANVKSFANRMQRQLF